MFLWVVLGLFFTYLKQMLKDLEIERMIDFCWIFRCALAHHLGSDRGNTAPISGDGLQKSE